MFDFITEYLEKYVGPVKKVVACRFSEKDLFGMLYENELTFESHQFFSEAGELMEYAGYDKNGKRTEHLLVVNHKNGTTKTFHNFDPDTGDITGSDILELNLEGKMTSYKDITIEEDEKVETERCKDNSIYEKDDKGRIIKVFNFNDEGEYINQESLTWNENGKIELWTTINRDGKLIHKQSSTFNEKDLLIEERDFYLDRVDTNQHEPDYNFFSLNNPFIYVEKEDVTYYKYDEHGRMVEKTKIYNKERTEVTINKYVQNQLVESEEFCYNAKGELEELTARRYTRIITIFDDSGMVVKRMNYAKDGLLYNVETNRYASDQYGNITSIHEYSNGNLIKKEIREIEYWPNQTNNSKSKI